MPFKIYLIFLEFNQQGQHQLKWKEKDDKVALEGRKKNDIRYML